MANPEHVEQLKQGVAEWNAWRQKQLEFLPDLSSTDLNGTNLYHHHFSGANLSGVNFRRAGLRHVDLRGANLSGANLFRADLSWADLGGADLSGADLGGASFFVANLSNANLSGANLSDANLAGGADLSGANLSGTYLNRANLSHANLSHTNFHATTLYLTIFASVNLCTVEGLDTAIHYGPSIVDVRTVKFPEGETRINFLQGAGFSNAFIDYLPSLLTTAIQFASCFISYAHQDEALAQHLYKDLQNKGVRCWFAPHDMRTGQRIRYGINEAIRQYDKLILILSKDSIASTWVEFEVEAALDKEKNGSEVLFPIRLDSTVLDSNIPWAKYLKQTRHICDFTYWKNHEDYKKAFDRLLRDLKAGA